MKAYCPQCERLIVIQKEYNPTYFLCECYASLKTSGDGRNMNLKTLELQQDILKTFNEIQMPMTVRQVFYQMVNKGWAKEESFYRKVQAQVLNMRRNGQLPYFCITDGTRYSIKQRSYNSLKDAIDLSIHNFKLDIWASNENYVEVWMEKDALASIFQEVTSEYDVPLHVSRGFASESFIYQSAEVIKSLSKPTTILMFTDHDPSGLVVDKSIQEGFRRMGAKVDFVRCALNQDQIDRYNLPTRPTKKSNHSKGFKGESVELDALHPRTLQNIIRNSLRQFIADDRLEAIHREEETLRNAEYELLY